MMTAPTEPATWAAPPVKCVAAGEGGVDTIGFVPLPPPEMVLTSKDGQGVPSDVYAAVRVIIFGGAAEGQSVPQGAVTVDVDCVLNQSEIKGPFSHGELSYLSTGTSGHKGKGCKEELHGEESVSWKGLMGKTSGGERVVYERNKT